MAQPASLILAFVAIFALPPNKTKPVDAPPEVTLQNNTLPGFQTTHDIIRTVRRTTKRPKFVETLSYEQTAQLVQCNIALPQAGKILAYQMLVDRPAKVLKLFRGKDEVKPTPPAAQFSLSRGLTKLTSEKKTGRECPTPWPLTDAAQTVILSTMLDTAYWPAKRIEAGHKWERQIENEAFDGKQTLQFVDLAEVDGQKVARIALKVTGKFKGPLERDYALGNVEGIIQWSRLDKTLVRLEGLATYQRRRSGVVEDYDLKVEAGLTHSEQISEKQQETVKEQMTAFLAAMQAADQGSAKDARAACSDFRKAWPGCIWLPAIAELEQRVTLAASTGADRMDMKQLKGAIVRSAVTYEAARSSQDYDLLERTVITMSDVARDYGPTLGKFCRDKDDATRANAAFALAFGRKPQDLAAVHKCLKDSSPRVRTMALTGLGAAGNTRANAELLLDALDDADVGVRRRALQAVAACVPREHVLVARLVERIDRLMVHDKLDGVRSDAVSALVAIGAPADVPRLEQALKHELNTAVREQIHNGIETLRHR